MGLGTFIHEYKIWLKPNSQPFALCTPRNVQDQTELQPMKNLGVISHVNEPTLWWYATMVVVLKTLGAIRMCVDMKPLNECLC